MSTIDLEECILTFLPRLLMGSAVQGPLHSKNELGTAGWTSMGDFPGQVEGYVAAIIGLLVPAG